MNRCLQKIAQFGALSLILSTLGIPLKAQTDGEMRSRSNNAGWGSASTWAIYSASTDAWSTSTVLTTGTSIVTLRDGFNHTSNGSGYTAGTLTVGQGNAFKGTAVISGGVLTDITINDPGKLVAISSGIGIFGPATVQATASVSAYKVVGMVANNKGSGYSTATVTFGSAWTASTAYSQGTQRVSNGNLYTVETGGVSGATSGPSGTTDFIADGTVVWRYAGPNATATPTISGGKITDIVVTNSGSGYTSAPVVTLTGNGTGADYALLLGVERIRITNGGSGYTTAPRITFGTNFYVGNASTDRTFTLTGDLNFKSGANIISGGGSTSVAQTLLVGGNISAETPISFRTYGLTSVGNTNVTMNKAGTATTSGADMTFNNLIINSGTTLNVTNNIIILGTLTNNGIINNSGSITYTTLSGTGTFSGNPIVLPIKLSAFKAIANASSVTVSWNTTAEKNVNKFIVEKSIDGKTFTSLTEVKAKGPSAYTIVDNSPVSGTNYYRLIQFDNDGASKVYGPVMANFGISTATLAIVPNPTTVADGVSFSIEGVSGNARVILSTLQGRIIHTETINNITTGIHKLNLKKALNPGQYILRFTNNRIAKSAKVVVL